MKYFLQLRTESPAEITQIVSKLHLSPYNFGFYFDNKSTVRVFADSKPALERLQLSNDIQRVPKSHQPMQCKRVRAIERQTPRQKQKRIARLKEHLAKKGIEYKDGYNKPQAAYDYFINMYSHSNGSSYRLYVHNSIVEEQSNGLFSSYGLSLNGSTIPYF